MEQSRKDSMDRHKYNCVHYTLVHKGKTLLDPRRIKMYRK
jgi:hypothetical protein